LERDLYAYFIEYWGISGGNGMNKTNLAVLSMIILLIGTVESSSGSEDNHDIRVGDYWEYEMSDVELEETTMEISMETVYRFEVESLSQMNVDGEIADVFNIEMKGNTEFSASQETMLFTGEFSFSGIEKRLASNFSKVHDDLEIEIEMASEDLTISFTINSEMDYNPPFDDYVGDTELEVGQEFASRTEVNAEVIMIMNSIEETDTEVYEEEIFMEVVEKDISVTTPAGTFQCYKLRVTQSSEVSPISGSVYWYYSDEVGNYVKAEGGFELSGISGELMELKSFSYGEHRDSGLLSMFTGDNLWLTLIIIAAVIIIVFAIAVIRNRKRGKKSVLISPQESSTPIAGPEVIQKSDERIPPETPI